MLAKILNIILLLIVPFLMIGIIRKTKAFWGARYGASIFQPFYESLPIAGVDGTLEHRMKKSKAYRKIHAKTGTVTGISSLAGYAKAANGHQLAFVIINQNVIKARQARIFQDKICEILCTSKFN